MNASSTAIKTARVLSTLKQRWYVIVAAALVGGAAAFALSSTVTPIFHSTSSLYFALRSGSSGSDINQGSTYTQNQMLSFARLTTSATVLTPVIEELGLDMTEAELRRALVVTIPQDTVVLDVRVGSADKALAAEIANRIAEQVTIAVEDIAPRDAEDVPTVSANVIEPAVPAQFQTTPSKQRDSLLGIILGAMLAAISLTLATLLDTRVRSESALKAVTELPLLGTLSRVSSKTDNRLIVVRLPNGLEAEQFRKVRSGLRFASASHPITSLGVTSSIPGEGKSTVAANLAVTMAETGARVLLIDADLRRPRIAGYLGVENSIGLTTVLVGGVSFEDAVHRWGQSSLDVLAAGEVPPNPAELLASARMEELIGTVSGLYEFIVVDTAPVLSVADATVIAHHLDSMVVVADSGTVRQVQLSQTLRTLERTGAHVAGLVLNKMHAPSKRDVYYYRTDRERAEVKKTHRREHTSV